MVVIAIIGAMDEEITLVKERMAGVVKRDSIAGPIYEGELHGRKICLVKSGVGKVLAAMVAQMLCQMYDIELLIVTGVAGGINPNYKIGHVCIGVESIQYDMDVSALGFSVGEVPFTDYRFIQSDRASIARLQSTSIPGVMMHFGTIGTGDTFVHTDALRASVWNLGCDVVDMETAAIAQVAVIHDAPYIAIRSISDSANETAPKSFTEIMPQLAATNLAVIKALLRD